MKLYRKCDNLSIGIFLTGASDFLTYKSGATMPVGSPEKGSGVRPDSGLDGREPLTDGALHEVNRVLGA
jgi:hypothetical protein